MNVIAVDVGTASVRLAIISFQGDSLNEATVLASHKEDVSYKQDGCRFEQSSSEIWSAICDCCKTCLERAKIKPDSIRSIAFSATCSLVVESEVGHGYNDIIMWMDHRAIETANEITASGSKVLNQFGGICSPEFSLAKLAWLQKNEPRRFAAATGLFELPDWLVYRCIGTDPSLVPRSSCCVTCKWGYDVDQGTHCDILRSLGKNLSQKIGKTVLGPGTVAGCMSMVAARELGILQDSEQNKENREDQLTIVVGTSLIDAHSGMLAMLSVPSRDYNVEQSIESTFCSLAGTSSCHMLLSKAQNFTPGVWGPYKNVIIEDYSLLEAGQSLTGRLIEMCIESHEEGKMRLLRGEKSYDIVASLNEQIDNNFKFDGDLHVMPSYHGNRSPLANPRLRGGIYGFSAGRPRNLLEHYMATVEALVYETKLIVETLGTKLNTILVSGGLMKNQFYMQSLADILQTKVITMSLENIDFMVMGSGLVARHAALARENRTNKPLTRDSVMGIKYSQMNMSAYFPRPERSDYHRRRYLCYKEFVEFSLRVDKIMNFV